eukprot:7379310-Prymnesium_polylepis.1
MLNWHGLAGMPHDRVIRIPHGNQHRTTRAPMCMHMHMYMNRMSSAAQTAMDTTTQSSSLLQSHSFQKPSSMWDRASNSRSRNCSGLE